MVNTWFLMVNGFPEIWFYVGVSINGGTQKWLIYKGKSQSKMDDLRSPPFYETPMWFNIVYHR